MSVVIAEESRAVGRRVTKVGPGRKRIQGWLNVLVLLLYGLTPLEQL